MNIDPLKGGTIRARWTGPCHEVDTKTLWVEYPYGSPHEDIEISIPIHHELADFIRDSVEEKILVFRRMHAS